MSRLKAYQNILRLSFFLSPVALATYFNIIWFLIILVSVFIFFYAISLVFKTSIFAIKGGSDEIKIKREQISQQSRSRLPKVTVLLPLYKEKTVVTNLIRNIQAQTYPTSKLDVKLLLEKDDEKTIEEVYSRKLPPNFEILVLDSVPKTKPAALQAGLAKARGDVLVVYDAEDKPEASQIMKAAIAFRSVGEDVACLQSTLRLRDVKASILAKFFSAEYSNHYGLYLPFFVKAGLVTPLGGTSNFFRVNVLRKLGGWDPNNVTEDADLGVRLARAGYKVKMINSITSEEPNTKLWNWIRQRSRWIKGYLQTWIDHSTSLAQLYSDLGFPKFIAFHIVFGLGPLFALVNPIFWFMTAWYFVARPIFIESLFPAPLFYLALVCTLGNIAFIVIQMSACMKERQYDKVVWMLLVPAYWVLISIGAWYGFYQLLTRPSYWEKTEHGLQLTRLRKPSTTVVTSMYRK